MGNNEKTGKINRLASGKHSYPLPVGQGGNCTNLTQVDK